MSPYTGTGRGHPGIKKEKICIICNTSFVLIHKNQKYCSRACYSKIQATLPNKGRFKNGESHAMSEEHKAKLRAHLHKIHKGGTIIINCGTCGIEVTIKLYRFYRHGVHFCSRKCAGIHHSLLHYGKHAHNWTGGFDKYRGPEYDKNRPLALRRDKVCRICGASRKLDVHHLRPFRESKDNSLYNLITLCHTCHTIVHNKNNLKEVESLLVV